MDIEKIFNSLQQFVPEFASSYCVVNGAIIKLDEIQNMGCREFGLRSKLNMPPKLYKYFPNKIDDQAGINYSLQALRNNTVFMQSPSNFDDVYDSDISIDFFQYEKLRLIEYCLRCGISIDKTQSTQEIGDEFVKLLHSSLCSTGNLNSVFSKKPDSEIEKLSNENFLLSLEIELRNGNDLGKATNAVICSEFQSYSSQLKNVFRTSCFSTTPYSQLMWGGAYADCHRGFCLEYTILPNNSEYQNVYQNLFPMIYCKMRPDMTERIVKAKDKKLDEDILWDIYLHGALRKSIDWLFQNEWRLLLPMNSKDISDYNVLFFPITKVFLGNRMPRQNREEIIEICHSKEIPYVGVMRNPYRYEMQDCSIQCEKCPKYINQRNITTS